jgi:hypothetical protein
MAVEREQGAGTRDKMLQVCCKLDEKRTTDAVE